MLSIRITTVAAALAIALPAFAGEPADPCKDQAQLQNESFRRECAYLAEAEAANAELRNSNQALREFIEKAEQIVDQIERQSVPPPK